MSSGYTAPVEASEPWVGSEADSWEFVDAESGEVPAAGASQLPEPVVRRWTGEDYKREKAVPFLPLGVTDRHRLLACTDLPGFGEFSFPALADLYYDPELLSTPVLADIRIARAVRAGISAAQKLSGERAATVPSVKLCGCPKPLVRVLARTQSSYWFCDILLRHLPSQHHHCWDYKVSSWWSISRLSKSG